MSHEKEPLFFSEGVSVESRFSQHPFYRLEELAAIPPTALRLSRGCGNPAGFASILGSERIVDFGCGGGADALLAARRITDEKGVVVGIDASEEMIREAEQALSESGLVNQRIFFRLADIEQSSLLPRNFADILICNCVLFQCPDKIAVYNNIFRALKPGGVFILCDLVRTDGENQEFLSPSGHQIPDRRKLKGMITEADHRHILRHLSFQNVRVEERILFSAWTKEGAAHEESGLPIIAACLAEHPDFSRETTAAVTLTATRPPFSC